MSVLDGVNLHFANNNPAPPVSKPLLCLLFSAQWCPDCTGFLPKLVDAYKGFSEGSVDVVFVSSDRSKEAQLRYMKEAHHPDWLAVDFSGDDRANLKRRFGACASAEVSSLGMSYADRKSGLPTLAVLRASDGILLTLDGVKDVKEAGGGAVERWQKASEDKQA